MRCDFGLTLHIRLCPSELFSGPKVTEQQDTSGKRQRQKLGRSGRPECGKRAAAVHFTPAGPRSLRLNGRSRFPRNPRDPIRPFVFGQSVAQSARQRRPSERSWRKCVNHVSGLISYLCARPLTISCGFSIRLGLPEQMPGSSGQGHRLRPTSDLRRDPGRPMGGPFSHAFIILVTQTQFALLDRLQKRWLPELLQLRPGLLEVLLPKGI